MSPRSEANDRAESESTADTAVDDGLVATIRAKLETIRVNRRRRAVALVLAVGLGAVFAWLHWFGLVLAGALVGLVSTSLPRAIATAVGFGVFVVGLFVITLGAATPQVLEMAPIVYLTIAAAIGLPVLGSLVRGLV